MTVKAALKLISSHLKNIWPTKRHLILKMSPKTVAKSLSGGVVQLAILCIYISRIVYDSATVKIVSFHRRFLVVAFFVVRGKFQAAVKCCLESFELKLDKVTLFTHFVVG